MTLLPNVAASSSFVDSRVLGVSVAIATLSELAASLALLVQSRHTDLARDLRDGGAQGASRRFGMHRVLVGAQTALCMTLLVGAALFRRSLDRVQSQDRGLTTNGLLYVTLDFRGNPPAAERDRFYVDAVERVRALRMSRARR